ncbi:MAG: phosphopantetheine-binding protein [Pseudomonadota bacterium]
MTQEIVNQLKLIVANELDVNIKLEEIDDNVSLFEEGIGLDSVAIMEFIALIETNFNIQFSDDELNLEPFKDLKTLAEFISSRLA